MEPMGGRAQGSWQQEGGAEQGRPYGLPEVLHWPSGQAAVGMLSVTAGLGK